ncbi:MAG: sigE 11 [Gemmataceae bacterium]|nr:sigE 11 [Gemmataceae bacterium]
MGDNAISIEPTDGAYRQILKARLHQATQEARKFKIRIEMGGNVTAEFLSFSHAVEEMRSAVIDLWADDPEKLIPRLEEIVILAKELERIIDNRVSAGSEWPHQLHMAYRYRLAAEAALWKAKNGKLGGR